MWGDMHLPMEGADEALGLDVEVEGVEEVNRRGLRHARVRRRERAEALGAAGSCGRVRHVGVEDGRVVVHRRRLEGEVHT